MGEELSRQFEERAAGNADRNERGPDNEQSETGEAANAYKRAVTKQYRQLLKLINSSLKNGEIDQERADVLTQQLDEESERNIGLRISERLASLEAAREIMGEQFYGPEAVEKTFGIEIEMSNIPEIPFSTEELERAKELGQILVLRIEKGPDGQPLTLLKMNDLLQADFDQHNQGKILYEDSHKWLSAEENNELKEEIAKEAPREGWALVEKTLIPNSTSKDYFQQTRLLVRHLLDDVFVGTLASEIPEEYHEAIDEFIQWAVNNFGSLGLNQQDVLTNESQDDRINSMLWGSEWEKYARQLSGLKINQLLRQTPVEVGYDTLVVFKQSDGQERIHENDYTWTSRQSSDGGLASVGYFNADGLNVNRDGPDYRSDDLGVSLSRSYLRI